jgi:hypothetical protein
MSDSRHVSIVIHRPVAEVVAIAGDAAQLAHWASGLASGVEFIDGAWVAQSPMGAVLIEFAPANDLGVIDHWVTVPSGERFFNPMRVIEHPAGAEVLFTLRRHGLSDAEFDADAATIAADLASLRDLVEAAPR